MNTENTAALTFCVNVKVRNIVALGLPLGLDGPAPTPGIGVPSVPFPIPSTMIARSVERSLSETNDEKRLR